MKVLVACECSGVVRDAFLGLGHDAISCDLKPTQSPGPHLHCDVREVLHHDWDLMIAHPVCKFLTNAGVRWLHTREGRWEKMLEAAAFFAFLDNSPAVQHIPFRCIENPVMHGHGLKLIGRKATQFVQPWMFGEPFQKATGLWLTGLPRLIAENKKTDYPAIKQEIWLMGPSEDREEKRSKTYAGIARAMALQWGSYKELGRLTVKSKGYTDGLA